MPTSTPARHGFEHSQRPESPPETDNAQQKVGSGAQGNVRLGTLPGLIMGALMIEGIVFPTFGSI